MQINWAFKALAHRRQYSKRSAPWLKEQLGSGLHPNQLRQDGEFNGHRGDARSWLRIYATHEEEPKLYAWVLKTLDEVVPFRIEKPVGWCKRRTCQERFHYPRLKSQLERAGGGRTSDLDAKSLLDLACRTHPPTPAECIDLIESIYGDECIVLATAKSSAQDMNRFINGRDLLRLLRRLVTDYRGKLMERGDAEARKVFGRNEYAAKESETVMANKGMRRERTFEYEGQQVEMFSHVKIGVDNDLGKTISVHFHWDAEREKIVIGYCGAHLTIPSEWGLRPFSSFRKLSEPRP
jgi:hypothetical protein